MPRTTSQLNRERERLRLLYSGLTVQFCAEVTNVDDDQVLGWIADGTLKAYDIGREGAKRKTWRIPAPEFEAFVKKRLNNRSG